MSATFEPRSSRGGTEVLILRLVIAALVAALGAALWVSGHVLIGGLILALAVIRLVLFFTMRSRRNQWRPRGGSPRHLGSPPSPDAPLPYEPPV